MNVQCVEQEQQDFHSQFVYQIQGNCYRGELEGGEGVPRGTLYVDFVLPLFDNYVGPT